jgi:hypothetical protein
LRRDDGVLIRTIGEYGTDDGQLNHPRSVAYWASELYVCDNGNNRVVVFGMDGSYQRSFAIPPRSVISIANNALIVASSSTHQLEMYT